MVESGHTSARVKNFVKKRLANNHRIAVRVESDHQSLDVSLAVGIGERNLGHVVGLDTKPKRSDLNRLGNHYQPSFARS